MPFGKTLLRETRCPPDVSIFVAFGPADLRKPRRPINTLALLVIVNKGFIALGPLHEPGKSVCFACLSHWIETSGALLELPQKAPGRHEAGIVSELVQDALSPKNLESDSLRTAMRVFDLVRNRSSLHPIFPRRDCDLCGCLKIPEQWGLRMHCGSLTGIVRKMEIAAAPAAGAWRAIAEWASPLPVRGARPLLPAQESHGRGRTREEAEQGCIGEALERYSLVYRGDEPLLRARLRDVQGIDPRHVLLYSDRQYDERESWNLAADERFFVGERFDPDRPIDWFPGFDLADGSLKFLPAACVLMWYPFRSGEPEYARADTIGCGSGWTFDDALAHALLEWIERDAMALWWYNRARRPAVRLESFAMPELLQVRDGLRRIGRHLFLLDCATDFGIPTYISVAPRQDGTELLFAAASHLSPRLAAWKAASEVGQLWYSAVRKNAVDAELKNWLALPLHSQPHFSPTREIEAPAEPPPFSSAELIRTIVARLSAAGLNAYAADLSRADVILKTARAVVPGLRHIWNRRAPGRLYDVPVQLGWIPAPLEEARLNPICCMV